MLTPDQIVERLKLKRQMHNWRLIAVIIAVALILTVFSEASNKAAGVSVSSYIARVKIDGAIENDRDRISILEDIEKNNAIKAVILHIDSPGGTVVGGEALYNAFRKISEKKPVVTVMGDVAASAAYMTSVATDYLIAHQGTMTGSIGVIAQSFEVTELANKLGVKFHTFRTSPLKGGPIPTEELSPEMKQSMYETLFDIYDMFYEMVATRRSKIPEEKLRALANGAVFTGRQALENGLIDAIGDESAALLWLQNVKKLDKNLAVRDIALENEKAKFEKFFESLHSISTSLSMLLQRGFIS